MSSNADEMLGDDVTSEGTSPAPKPTPMPAEEGGDPSGVAEDVPSEPGDDDGRDRPMDAAARRPREGASRARRDSSDGTPDSDRAPRTADDEDDEDDGPFVEDGRADRALDFVVDVLTSMGLDCTVDLMENGDDDPPSDIRIEVGGRDSDRLVGKKGQTLAAMQFLVNRVVNRPPLSRRHILLDAGGYRARRESALSSMALRLGQQASDEGKIITFEPMSAQDRRVVHLALAKFEGVVTKSEGKGATRRVQIIPVRD